MFQIVAEVLLERAESKGLKLLGEQLRHLVCDEIRWNGGDPVLPRTCEMLGNVQLKDIASGGRALVAVLVQDLVDQFKWDVACPAPGLASTCRAIGDLGARVFAGERLSLDTEIRHLALSALDAPAFDAYRPVIAECVGYGKCDEARIVALLQAYAPSATRAAASVVSDFLLSLGPAKGDANALQRLVDLGRAILRVSAGGLAPTLLPKSPPEVANRLLEAAFNQDLGGVAVAAIEEICPHSDTGGWCRSLRKVAHLAVALGANFTSSDGKPEDKEAARAARKKAINALIDTMTSWDERRGDWLVSLGASAGWAGGGAIAVSDDGGVRAQTQPTIAAGIGLSYVSGGETSFVFHTQLSPIDLGTYARAREDGTLVQPEDVVRPTLSMGIGVLPKKWDEPLLLTGMIGYSVSRSNQDEAGTGTSPKGETHPLFVGVALGVYFSFFDLN
ncbi:MAG: hypothetical protein U0414_40780 [Polyangiaceae bacterium]